MAENKVGIVLTEEKVINGRKRKSGYVLFEGACSAKTTVADLNKAIQLGQVEVKQIKVNKPKIEEPSK